MCEVDSALRRGEAETDLVCVCYALAGEGKGILFSSEQGSIVTGKA